MIIENWSSIWYYGITQSRHCNNDNDDNVIHASIHLNSLVDYFNVKTLDIWEGICDNKEGDVVSWGPRLPLVAKSCPIMLAAQCHICWAKFQLKNLCSTNSSIDEPWWGQLLSVYAKSCPRHSFITNALWMTNQRKVVSFYTLCSYQMIIQFEEVEGGISFHHLLEIGFLRLLSSIPLPPNVGQICHEMRNLKPPPPC